MRVRFVKGIFLFLIIAAGGTMVSAQNLTGIWRGYFITESGDQYKFELQVAQNKSNRITGVSYSYLTTVFYGKASVTGFYNKSATSALVQEIKTLEVRMSGTSMSCIQKFKFDYAKSGKEEFLEGSFSSMYENTNTSLGLKRGGDCGGGKIYLRKVPTSDFYVEPFLRSRPQTPDPNTITKSTTPKSKPGITGKTTVKKAPSNPAASKPIVKTPPPKKITKDTLTRRIAPPVVVQEPTKTELPKLIPAPPVVIRNRESNLLQTLTVQNGEITVKLYDNGEVDDDTISVYMDDQLVLSKKRLSAAPLTFNLKMDENTEHNLTMVAENLGRIPPNTSLMIVHDGDKRYEVRITSTETKNAVVKFRYVKSE